MSDLVSDLLLVSNGTTASTLCSCVCLRALASGRQTSTVAKATVAADIDQSSDVHLDLASEVSFDDRPTLIECATNPVQLLFAELPDTRVAVKRRVRDDALGHSRAYAVNGLQRNLYALVVRYVHSSDECHVRCSLKPER